MEKRKARRRMKKLYAAEFNGTFCFVIDTDIVKEDRVMEEAYKHQPEMMKYADITDIDNVCEIESGSEVPADWHWRIPLGAKEVYGEQAPPDCESFFERKEEAVRIAGKLKKLDYDLEPTFIEDLQKILNDVP